MNDGILRPVVGYEGIYSITADGRVWSEKRTCLRLDGQRFIAGGKWLKPTINCDGYLIVNLCKIASQRHEFIHRLVADAWVENRGRLPLVNHLDGVKTNNIASNLEWCTHAENMAHAHRTGLIKKSEEQIKASSSLGKKARVLTFDQAQEIRRLVAGGLSRSEISQEFGVSYSVIGGIVRGSTYISP